MIGVAAQFSFSVSLVDKLLHRQRTTGSIAAADLKAPVRDKLRACLRQGSDTTLGKLGAWLATIGRPAVSHSNPLEDSASIGTTAKKECPRHQARYPTGRKPTASLCEGPAKRRFYLFQFRR